MNRDLWLLTAHSRRLLDLDAAQLQAVADGRFGQFEKAIAEQEHWPVAGNLRGAFVVFRRGSDRETIFDWGVHQLPVDPHPKGYRAEIICETSVPIYAAEDPRAIGTADIERAERMVIGELTHQVNTRADLAGIRQQFERVRAAGKGAP